MTAEAERLIAEARAGDAATLGRLLELYRNYLRLLARVEIGRRLQGKVDASDVVQEAFLDAHRYFPTSAAPPSRSSSSGCARSWPARWPTRSAATSAPRPATSGWRSASSPTWTSRPRASGLVPVDPHSSPSQQAARGEQASARRRRPGPAAGGLPGGDRPAAPGGADVPAGGRADGPERGQRREAVAPRADPPAARVREAAVTSGPDDPADDPRVLEAAREYLADLEAGRAPTAGRTWPPPGLADALAECLDGLDLAHAAGRAMRPTTADGAGPPGRAAGRLPHRPRGRPRRHGRRLRGGATLPRPAGGAEGAAVRRGAGPAAAPAVPDRGPGRGPAAPHQHRAGVRGRLRARRPLLRHAAHRRPAARRGDPRVPRRAGHPRQHGHND